MNNLASKYLKFANLQIAAEAFLQNRNVDSLQADIRADIEEGNTHTSKFPSILAEQFAQDWVVVNQRKNIQAEPGGTGFSGTLFRSRQPDPSGSYEYVISFRSTEFLDDAVRDNKATNEFEIKNTGWAFGQIAEMEEWYAQIQRDGLLPAGQNFYVTGYSLGGHLATAFNILRREQQEASRVIETYTFNGAGVGSVRNGRLPR